MGRRTSRAPRRTVAKLALAAMTLSLAAACAKVAGIDELEVGDCKGGTGALCLRDEGGIDGDPGDTGQPDLDGAIDRNEGPCPGNAGPVAVWVGGASNRFCIDTTEVTVKDYNAFLAATDGGNATPALLSTECTWKTKFVPAAGGPDEVPQTGVDWCDAYAYCKWAGKRLCGKSVGGKPQGPISVAELADFNVNQWLIACSLQGQLTYPYGSLRKAGVCNLLDRDAGRALAVKEADGCVGAYPGVYDMLGNVWEWVDSCRPRDAGADVDAGDGGPAKMECLVKGGSFATTPPTGVNCRVDGTGATRDLRVVDVGFRCCSPP